MTEEKYEEIKKDYVSNIRRYMTEMGGIFPHITVFGKHKEPSEGKDAIVHIQVPGDFMKSEEMKETFMEDVLPKISLKIREMMEPYGVAWTSEAWLRSMEKDDKLPDNWKDLPIKKEILLVSMEFTHKKEAFVYEIKRLGKQVNEDGELVDHVDLIEEQMMSGAEQMSGRFTGLLEKFKGS